MYAKQLTFKHKLCRLFAAAIFIAQTAFSATPDDQIEEVIITADFYNKSLMNSAGSVSVLDSTQIKESAAQHIESLLHSVPNINWAGGASRSRFLQIRGIGDLEQFQDPKNFPSVGINIDDLELGDTANAGMLFDVEQVEILRGPQGTRFGATGHAGLINIKTADPTETFEGSVSAGVGNYDSWHTGVVLSGKVADTVTARLAVQRNDGDGYIKNRYLNREDTNGYDELSARGKIHWQASDRFRLKLTTFYFDSDNGYDTWSFDDPRETFSDQPGKDALEIQALSLKGEWQLAGDSLLEAIITNNDSEHDYSYDADWVSPQFCVDDPACSPGDTDTATERFYRQRDTLSAELRLLSGNNSLNAGESNYVIGLYTRRHDEDLDYQYLSVFFGDYTPTSEYETQRTAVYGRYQLALSDQLQLISGLRFEYFSDDYQDSNGFNSDQSHRLWNGEISMQYQADNNTLFYGTLSRGEKPGGVNTNASSNQPIMSPSFQQFTADKLRFDSETLLNKELGIKTLRLDGRLNLRAALFHTSRDQAQLETWLQDGGLWIGYLDSNSDATSYGAELEGSLQMNDHIQWFGAIGWLKTEVDRITVFDYDVFDFVTKNHRDQAKSPEYQLSLGANIQFDERFSGRIEWQKVDDSFFGYYHDGKLDDYQLIHANLSYRQGNIDINLWGRNLSDEDYDIHGLYFGADPRNGWTNETYLQRGEPRTYGISINYSF